MSSQRDELIAEFAKLQEFSQAFNYEHDNEREIAIVGCAYIESLLGDILVATFLDDRSEVKNLIGEAGPLNGLVARARLLYLLGVIHELVYKDIKIIGKIRNEFAHKVSASFADDRIKDLCRNLKWYEFNLFMKPPAEATARDIYQVGVNQVVAHLGALPGLQRYNRAQRD